MDAVDDGETVHITRNGSEFAELRPVTGRRKSSASSWWLGIACFRVWSTRRCVALIWSAEALQSTTRMWPSPFFSVMPRFARTSAAPG
ncbi:hypothetical protein [Streptomyces sp. NRRL WC-3618]|uniref:hypothetical protein n=1 Tax=Streptomyces sp. NRRL WC-3618 TaxID=1519490 RepID=UPI0007C7EFE4|nr:hypothetical protein [Streptomyces sp. NRRL WC-3618]